MIGTIGFINSVANLTALTEGFCFKSVTGYSPEIVRNFSDITAAIKKVSITYIYHTFSDPQNSMF